MLPKVRVLEGCFRYNELFPKDMKYFLSQNYKYVILEDGTRYCEADREFYFSYNNKVCCLTYPETYTGEVDIESFIEMKNMLIEE